MWLGRFLDPQAGTHGLGLSEGRRPGVNVVVRRALRTSTRRWRRAARWAIDFHHGLRDQPRLQHVHAKARPGVAEPDDLSDAQRVPLALDEALVVDDRAVAAEVLDPPRPVLEKDARVLA